MNYPDLFQHAAERAKERAISRAERHASETAVQDFRDSVEALPPGTQFTTDDLNTSGFHDARGCAGPLRKLAKEGAIVALDEYRNSESITCHARPKRVWLRL